MEFKLAILIEKTPSEVFAFQQDLYQLPFHEHPVVPVYEKATPGPVGVGTRLREVVRVPLLSDWQILSEITAFQPESYIEYKWTGPGMQGELAYHIEPAPGGARLAQRQTLNPIGLLQILNPFIGWMFSRQIAARLEGIKAILEGRARFAETPSAKKEK